jgi:hypothetical protein
MLFCHTNYDLQTLVRWFAHINYYYLFTAIGFALDGSSPTLVQTKTIKKHYTVVQHNTIGKHTIIRTQYNNTYNKILGFPSLIIIQSLT